MVGEARDGEEAVRIIRSLRPDVALIDIRMPNRGGLSVLEPIQDMDPRPVAIVLTNYPSGAYRDRCMQLKADHFLDKATEFDQAVAIVRDVLATRRALA
ncbi:MAG TPA: response regulator [Gemmatimonadales bacterium]